MEQVISTSILNILRHTKFFDTHQVENMRFYYVSPDIRFNLKSTQITLTCCLHTRVIHMHRTTLWITLANVLLGYT